MKAHYSRIVEYTEHDYKWILRYQNMDLSSPAYGAYIDPEEGYEEPGKWGTGNCLNILVSLFYNEDSRYYGDQELLKRANAAAQHMLKNQNEDGTINQRVSNYNSTPGAAFTINELTPAYEILLKYSQETKAENKLKDLIWSFVERAGHALLQGGFHTPNHRWVISSALAKLYDLTSIRDYWDMAMRYLQEGIDINSDGGYTEKSVGGYDAVVDEALLKISDYLNKPELLTYVEKNLSMIIKYFQPDGSIFTGQSNRQDRGKKVYPRRYYGIYLQMAHRLNKPVFAYIADEIYRAYLPKSIDSGPEKNELSIYMLNEDLKKYRPKTVPYKKHFEEWMQASGIIRIRREDYAISIVEDNPHFLYLNTPKLSLIMRLSAAFFARGSFKAQSIKPLKSGYRLEYTVKYGYIQPFEVKPNSKEWAEMEHGDWADIKRFNTEGLYPRWEDINHGQRKSCQVQELSFQVDIKEIDKGVSVDISSDGAKPVLGMVEYILESGGILEHQNYALKGSPGLGIIAKQGYCRYRKGLEEVQFGPGFGDHLETCFRGTLPQDMGSVTVYNTFETPFAKSINIQLQGVNGG